MDVYGLAVAFRGNDRISVFIEQRIAILVSPSKLELRPALLVIKAKNSVDKAHAVRIIPDDLLRDARLCFESSNP